MSEQCQMRYVKKAKAVSAIRAIPGNLADQLARAKNRARSQETTIQATQAKEAMGWLKVFKTMNRGE